MLSVFGMVQLAWLNIQLSRTLVNQKFKKKRKHLPTKIGLPATTHRQRKAGLSLGIGDTFTLTSQKSGKFRIILSEKNLSRDVSVFKRVSFHKNSKPFF